MHKPQPMCARGQCRRQCWSAAATFPDSTGPPSRGSSQMGAPSATLPPATRPVAMRPRNGSCSIIVTSIRNMPDGSSGGGGTCSTIASSSGSMPVPGLLGYSFDAQPALPAQRSATWRTRRIGRMCAGHAWHTQAATLCMSVLTSMQAVCPGLGCGFPVGLLQVAVGDGRWHVRLEGT